VLRDVDDLKARSRRLRDQGKLEQAAQAVRQAIEIVEQELQQRNIAVRSAGEPAPQDVRDLAVQLADCYGSLAGILRRSGELSVALEFYGKGRELEQNDTYRINNTYNQVQWLILRVLLEPVLISGNNESMVAELRKTLQILRRQIATDRQQDPWAYSDVGLLHALLGDKIGADVAWNRMDAVHPIPSVYRSGLPVLEDLVTVLPDNDLLRGAAARFATKAQAR
jgi:tetratricopeptide (TPR) repeat protein